MTVPSGVDEVWTSKVATAMALDDVPENLDGRVERRRRGREKVYRAALALFLEKGFERSTFSDIAQRAGVARASVFNYFPTKTAFLEEWTAQRSKRVRSEYSAFLTGYLDQEQPLRETFLAYADALADMNLTSAEESAMLFGPWIRAHHSGVVLTVRETVTELMTRGQRRQEVLASIDADVIAITVAAAYGGLVLEWVDRGDEFDLKGALVGLVTSILDGILT